MAAKPKADYEVSPIIRLDNDAYKKVVETCAEDRKATPALKALFARAKVLTQS